MQMMTHSQPIRRPAPLTRRGTSLIEILVVLVILVIGILSIVRLFPAGFIALRNAQNNTFADRLAQGALESLKKDNTSLPDGIYMYSDDPDGSHPSWKLGFDPNVASTDYRVYDPDTNGFNQNGGTPTTPYDDINKQRYISNETVAIPQSHIVNGVSYPPLHTLEFGPIYLPHDYTNLTTPAFSVHYLHVVSPPWMPQIADSRVNPSDTSRSIDDPVDFLQPGQPKFLVDYNAGQIAVAPASYVQTFTIAIQPSSGPPETYTLTVPTSYTGGWFNTIDTTGNGTQITSGPWTSVTLTRPFAYEGTSTTPVTSGRFDNDPYEFVVYDSNYAMGGDANPGVLAFNPKAAGQAGLPALKARISYMALDWHILHEDHSVSEGSPTVRLTLGHLKKVGDVQFDQSLFGGVVSKNNETVAPDYPADVMMLDLDTGDEYFLNGSTGNLVTFTASINKFQTFPNESTDADQTNPPVTTSYQVSYQNGRITLPDNSTAHDLRIYYGGDADWALAIQKAPSVYNVLNAGTSGVISAPVAANYQALTTTGPMPNNCVVDFASQRVYFPLCDAGKTVEFDGITYADTSNTVHQVGEGTAMISTDTTNVGGQNVVYVNLGSTGLNSSGILPSVPSTGGATSPSIQAVRGISAQAVVIWHEHNNWRTRTIDTLLTQTQ